MARFRDYIPQGVIPAALLAFDDDFEINESETRRHFLYLSNVEGVTAITVNGHSSEVHACSHDEQSLILRLASETVPKINIDTNVRKYILHFRSGY